MDNDNPFLEMLRLLSRNIMVGMMVGLPGKILSFNAKTQRAQVECGIQKHRADGSYVTLPVIENVPVKFSGSGEWVFFHELPEGTEGFIHFSQRSISNWIDRGGPVPPSDNRLFNMSDAFFSPGYRSLKTCIPDLPDSGAGISNKDGSVKFHLTSEGIEFTAGGQTLSLTGDGLKHNDVNIGSTHRHGGVESGGSTTNIPE